MPDFGKVVLSTAYLPNIQYVTKFILYKQVYIEQYENFQKQSFRNRCIIYGANGPMSLVIPVKKNHEKKTVTRDIEIDYDTKWQHQHWKSIYSAYKNSPFFDYFEDDFYPFYIRKEKYLLDFNFLILKTILKILEINCSFQKTSKYLKTFEGDDFRVSIHPKKRLSKPDDQFIVKNYCQVFSDKHGFMPNLSIIDLIFNNGLDAYSILKQSISTNLLPRTG